MRIRFEERADVQAIRSVNVRAFARSEEANLVDAIRASAAPRISLVAEERGAIVGHILFTPVTIRRADQTWSALGLGPLAVLPPKQRQGIGAELVRAGLCACREAGHAIVFVTGAAQYYRRFGFLPAAPLGLIRDLELPDDEWMVNELEAGSLRGRTGIVSYRPEFTSR